MKNDSFRLDRGPSANSARRPWEGVARRKLLRLCAAVALGVAGANAARAGGTITNCTEAALQTALVGGGLVTLSCNDSILLTQPIVFVADTVLDGTGHSPTLAGGQITNLAHLLIVPPGVRLELRSVTISGAIGTGLAGTNGSSGELGSGSAIFVDGGELVLDGCTLAGNRVVGGAGAIAVRRNATGGNGGGAAGAAVYNNGGQIIVTNSLFTGNSAEGGAGGEGAAGVLMGNGSSGGGGGDGGEAAGAAIYNTAEGVVTIYDSTFSSNRVTGGVAALGGLGAGTFGFPGKPGRSGTGIGAAVFNAGGSITLVNSSVIGNTGQGAAGLAGDSGTILLEADGGSTGGRALGGGLFNAAGTVSLTNCTFAGNALTGGQGGTGGAGGARTFGAEGGDGGHGGGAFGAGVGTGAEGTTLIVNCSFSNNKVVGGAGGSGGRGTQSASPGDDGDAGQAEGGAIFNEGGSLRIRNSILAHSLSGSNAGGVITDEGFNLSSDATPAWTAAGSRNSVDPLFGGLTLAGGHALTLSLSSNSPAINGITAADGNGCPGFDQRNAFRVEPCDIGAFEFDGQSIAPALQAESSDGRIVLTWPATSSLVLQSAEGLAETNRWTTVTNPTETTENWRRLNLERTSRARFFRLVPQ